MNASEALFGFGGWLTSRDEVIVMSARYDAAPVAKAVAEFIKVNNLPEVRDGWEKNLIHPPAKKIGNPENSAPPAEQQTQPAICGQERSCRFQIFSDRIRCGAPTVIECGHKQQAGA